MVTQNMLRKDEEKLVYYVYDPIKYLKQINQQRVLLTCAFIPELPSHISTMVASGIGKSAKKSGFLYQSLQLNIYTLAHIVIECFFSSIIY